MRGKEWFSTTSSIGAPIRRKLGAWVCLRGLSGTPWKSRIVRDRANPVRLLPPPESAVETTPALPPGGGRRMSGWVFPPSVPLAAAAARRTQVPPDRPIHPSIRDSL
nr:hypothetical protein StreXyl84_29370 [Streptomyces sp. Xyl84]